MGKPAADLLLYVRIVLANSIHADNSQTSNMQEFQHILSLKITVVDMAELAVGVDIPIEFGVYGVYLSALAVLRSSAVMQGAGQAPIDLGTCGESSTATASHFVPVGHEGQVGVPILSKPRTAYCPVVSGS